MDASLPVKCANCEFYVPTNRGFFPAGQCRRYPPSTRGHSADAVWPLVEPVQWCGEYREKDDG